MIALRSASGSDGVVIGRLPRSRLSSYQFDETAPRNVRSAGPPDKTRGCVVVVVELHAAKEGKRNMASVNVAIIYYSATGTLHTLAQAVAEGAEKAGAQVRLRKVAETAPPEAIA